MNAPNFEKHPHSSTIVRFQDCDPLGHLNNSKYIDYFMNAREDHLRDYYNLDIYELSKNAGYGWVVMQNQISYLKPAFLNEKIVLESMLIYFDSYSVVVEMKMWDANKTKLKSVIWSRLVAVDIRTGKKTPIPKEFYLLEDIIVPVDISKGFEKRLEELFTRGKTQEVS
jgi:acyl-CoA thioester hydrolase